MKKYYFLLIIFLAYILTRQTMKQEIESALLNKNVQAFLATIRRFESNDDYHIIYGGSRFSDDSSHPNFKVPFHNPLRSGEGNNDFSTAAGGYQINWPTWMTTIQPLALLPDFTPASQDEAAVWLLKIDGALQKIINGDFNGAIKIASKRWASLPYSEALQKPVKVQQAINSYIYFGGQIA